MRRTVMQAAFEAVQIKPGEKLSPLHRKVMRSMERTEKDRQYKRRNRKTKGR